MRGPFIAALLLSLAIPAARCRADLSDVLGVTHMDGKYYLTADEDYLNEGADQVLATGTHTIKLFLRPQSYKWNSDWPKDVPDLAAMAATPYFKAVFAKPFRTFILTAYAFGREDHYWANGISAAQAADETRQFHDLAKYLLTTYRGTGKTFVIQHWEGDWALRHNSSRPFDPKYNPSQATVDGMIAWLNARQAGIVQARQEVNDTDVHVYGATECNRLEDSMAGMRGVVNSVLPHTTVDLVSYSSYTLNTSKQKLTDGINYIVDHLPPTAAFGHSPHSVYLGEYGWPEHGRGGAAEVNSRISNVVDVTRAMGVRYAIFWQIYCNEPKNDTLTPPLNGRANLDNLRGYWMVRTDGTPAPAWHRYRRFIITGDPSRATADAARAGLSLLFEDKFNRPDSATDIGPGWKQDAHFGPVSGQLKDHRVLMTMPNGATTPWTSCTLNLTDPKVLGRGLRPGEFIECRLHRLTPAGALGVELYDSDQLRQGSGIDAGPSPLQAWDGATFEPFSIDNAGQSVAFEWNAPHTLGLRFDSADGHFATYSYYIDGAYAGSWLINAAPHTLDNFGFFGQAKITGSAMEFTDLKIYGRPSN